MATRNSNWPTGTPCWADRTVQTEHRGMHHARDFYGRLFGWFVPEGPQEFGGYTIALKDGIPAAGMAPAQDAEQPSVWLIYFATDDIDRAIQDVRAAGGQVLSEPIQIDTAGTAVHCLDLEGAVFGLWQGGDHHGFGITNEPGSFAWASLLTRNLALAKSFYSNVFGFTYDEGPDDGTVLVKLVDGQVVGGLQEIGAEDSVPVPAWAVHFAVADRDSSAAIAEEEDATILSTFDSTAGPQAWIKAPAGENFLLIALDQDTTGD